MANIHHHKAWPSLLLLALLCGACKRSDDSPNAGNNGTDQQDSTEETAKIEQPAKTEQPAKAEQPAKTEQPAKSEQPTKNEETAKTGSDAAVGAEAEAPGSKCAEALVGQWRIGKIVSTIAINAEADPKARVVVQIPKRKQSVGSIECNKTGGGVLKINFVGDPGCCGGTLSDDGRTIGWSNGTKWKKQ